MGCGSPPKSFWGGEATANDGTPATWAGTTFITTLLGYTAPAAGHVEPDAVHRDPALGDRPSGHHLGDRVGAALVLVHGAGPPDALEQRGTHLRVEPGLGLGQRGGRHAQRRRTDPVEPLAPAQHGVLAVLADVGHDRAHGLDRVLDVDRRARQHVAGVRGPAAQVESPDHALHPRDDLGPAPPTIRPAADAEDPGGGAAGPRLPPFDHERQTRG